MSLRWSYSVSAAGIGGNAVAEGGYELNAAPVGQPAVVATTQAFRRRVSAIEQDTQDSGLRMITTAPVNLFIPAGAMMNFNVAVWATNDKSAGAGYAAAQAPVEATVLDMAFMVTTT